MQAIQVWIDGEVLPSVVKLDDETDTVLRRFVDHGLADVIRVPDDYFIEHGEKELELTLTDVLNEVKALGAKVDALLSRPAAAASAAPRAGARKPRAKAALTEVTTQKFKVRGVFEDSADRNGKPFSNPKVNISTDGGPKLGFWNDSADSQAWADLAKQAKANGSEIAITYGKNGNGYLEVSNVEEALPF